MTNKNQDSEASPSLTRHTKHHDDKPHRLIPAPHTSTGRESEKSKSKRSNSNKKSHVDVLVVEVEDEEPIVEQHVTPKPTPETPRPIVAPSSADEAPALPSRGDAVARGRRNRRSTNIFKRIYKHNKLSLSRAPTTPCWLSLLIPLLSILTHYIFYYGQTRPMWHLHLSEQVDLWANATNMESRAAMDTLGLPHKNYLPLHEEKQVKTFTYWYAIQELWKGKNLPGKLMPRFAAILLVVFSGVWPHLKLLLLNFTWMFSIHQRRRTRVLQWLSTLGKWSLADVLVVCVMVGVLDLDWTVDPTAIREGLINNLPFCLRVVKSLYSASDVCTILLKDVDCHDHHKSWKLWSECKACVGLVKNALDHPDAARESFKPVLDGIKMSGGGEVALRVSGLHGIYAFCGAVILSILLSFVVDIVDVRTHRSTSRSRPSRSEQHEHRAFLLPSGDDEDQDSGTEAYNDSNDGDSYEIDEPSLLPGECGDNHHASNDLENSGDEAFNAFIQSTSQPRDVLSIFGFFFLLIFCLFTLATVGMGIATNTIQRTVEGAIPALMRDVLGFVWTKPYSLFTLVQTTGYAGGWDFLLMGTFGLFVVVGPAIRAALCLVAWMVPLNTPNRRKLLAAIELVGAFCAWEVFVVAVCMVDMLMPSITSTVVMKPQCASVSEDGKCLQVNFDLLQSFHWILIGGVSLIAVSNWLTRNARRPLSSERSHGREVTASAIITPYTALGQDDR
mmetsp:Transcript_14177/g.30940  ORF Transcript_14177/g.30940 Transcript_14177/m.30940 type:complete len:729 (+) Transcript_14177:215-2401(+)